MQRSICGPLSLQKLDLAENFVVANFSTKSVLKCIIIVFKRGNSKSIALMTIIGVSTDSRFEPDREETDRPRIRKSVFCLFILSYYQRHLFSTK